MACICPKNKNKNFGRIIFPFLRANRGKLHFASALTILWQRSSAILTRISWSVLCTAWRWRPLKHVFCKKKKKRKKEKRHHGGNLKQLCNWRPRAPPNYLIPCGILIADLRINFCRKSRIPPFFSIAFPNSSFVSKSKDKLTRHTIVWFERRQHLTCAWLIRICRSNVYFPTSQHFGKKKSRYRCSNFGESLAWQL